MSNNMLDERSRSTVNSATKVDVKRFYDQYAGNWDKRFRDNLSTRHFHNRRVRTVEDMAQFKPTDVVLELGCGTAPYIEKLAGSIHRYVGVDISDSMLTGARQRSDSLGFGEWTSFSVDDAETLGSITDNSIDVVFFMGLVEHLLDLTALFVSCWRVLKPGGKLIGVCSNRLSPWYSIVALLFRNSVKHLSTDRYYRASELKQVALAQAFKDFRCIYWGFIPPGDFPDWIYGPAVLAEKIGENTVLRYLSGGISFCVSKP